MAIIPLQPPTREACGPETVLRLHKYVGLATFFAEVRVPYSSIELVLSLVVSLSLVDSLVFPSARTDSSVLTSFSRTDTAADGLVEEISFSPFTSEE